MRPTRTIPALPRLRSFEAPTARRPPVLAPPLEPTRRMTRGPTLVAPPQIDVTLREALSLWVFSALLGVSAAAGFCVGVAF